VVGPPLLSWSLFSGFEAGWSVAILQGLAPSAVRATSRYRTVCEPRVSWVAIVSGKLPFQWVSGQVARGGGGGVGAWCWVGFLAAGALLLNWRCLARGGCKAWRSEAPSTGCRRSGLGAGSDGLSITVTSGAENVDGPCFVSSAFWLLSPVLFRCLPSGLSLSPGLGSSTPRVSSFGGLAPKPRQRVRVSLRPPSSGVVAFPSGLAALPRPCRGLGRGGSSLGFSLPRSGVGAPCYASGGSCLLPLRARRCPRE